MFFLFHSIPVYLTQVVTGKGGMVTIDADNMKRTIPAGYYDVMYSSKTPPVVGMLRVIEITESEESSDDSSSGDISSRDISNGVPSSSGGCNVGIFALFTLAVMLRKKSA